MLAGALLRGAYAVARPLPRGWLLAAARVAAPLLAPFLPLGAVRRNLRILLSFDPDCWGGRSEARMLNDAIRHQLYTLVDFFKLVTQAPADIPAVTRVDGWETVEKSVAAGRGVVMVTAHYANWELVGALMAVRGLPVHAFYYQQLLPALDEFLAWARARSGMQMLHQRRGLRECVRALRAGGVVGFVADQDGSRDGVFLDFFGRLVSMPRGPFEFARHAGCDVLQVSCSRLSDGTYSVVIAPPLRVDSPEDVGNVARVIAAGFEADIRRDPAQWQLFYSRFWLRHVPRLQELGLLERAIAEVTRDDALASAPLPPGADGAIPEARIAVPGAVFLRLALVFYTPLFAVGLAWMAYRGRLASFLWQGSFARAAGLGLALGLGTVLLSRFLTSAFAFGRNMKAALGEVLGQLDARTAWALAAVSSVAEETLFRGALQPEAGLLVASLLFGLVHLPLERRLIPWTGFAIAMGFCLGALFDATGGLLAPTLAHFVVNAVNLTWLAEESGEGEPPTIHRPPA